MSSVEREITPHDGITNGKSASEGAADGSTNITQEFASLNLMNGTSGGEEKEGSQPHLAAGKGEGKESSVEKSVSADGENNGNGVESDELGIEGEGEDQARRGMNGGNEEKKIFVGGIAFDVTNDDLSQHFGQFGEIASVQVKFDRTTGRSRGFAFVEFTTVEACRAALDQREQQIKSKACEIKPAKSREAAFQNKKIFVGGLPSDFPEDELRRHFEQFGPVEDVEWPFDKITRTRRNFAFIVFEDEAGADRAAANPKQMFGSREADVKKAVPQSKRNAAFFARLGWAPGAGGMDGWGGMGGGMGPGGPRGGGLFSANLSGGHHRSAATYLGGGPFGPRGGYAGGAPSALNSTAHWFNSLTAATGNNGWPSFAAGGIHPTGAGGAGGHSAAGAGAWGDSMWYGTAVAAANHFYAQGVHPGGQAASGAGAGGGYGGAYSSNGYDYANHSSAPAGAATGPASGNSLASSGLLGAGPGHHRAGGHSANNAGSSAGAGYGQNGSAANGGNGGSGQRGAYGGHHHHQQQQAAGQGQQY